nr:copper-transporting ATPase [Haloplanus sp. XH21]
MRTDDSEPPATDDETHYFCSQTCKETFEERPDEDATGQPMV